MSFQVKILGEGVPTEVKTFDTEREAKEYVEELTTDDTPGWEERDGREVLVDLNHGHTPFVHYLTEE